ncbi:hypothetical protein [Micromonospora zhanjiangensis]|uniref:Uncharacterized protein n=1 Tax=Micromonospora zhanjiangensis TaxID=1522057 RepID=A0ABV8KY57_9ACTN
MVFLMPSKFALFCEYEALFAADFWPALTELAAVHGDSVVDLLVIEPNAASYYIPEYRMYPAFSLPVESNEDRYWDALNEEPEGDITGAVIHSANMIALSGLSARWGIWADRHLGIAVVQGAPIEDDSGSWRERNGPFLGVEDALVHYVAPNFGGQVPEALAGELTAKFGNRL